MKYLTIILLIIFSGCSAQWHLRKALEKDPDIINIQADTSYSFDISYKDTTIHFTKKIPFKLISDTAYVIDTVQKLIKTSFDTIKAESSDGIAHARTWMDKGVVALQTWAVKDTILTLKDSIQIQQKMIREFIEIQRENEATIKRKDSFIEQVTFWAKIVGITILVGFLIWLFVKIFK